MFFEHTTRRLYVEKDGEQVKWIKKEKKKQRCNVKNTHYNNALNLLRILFQMTKKTKRKGKKKKMMMENEKKEKTLHGLGLSKMMMVVKYKIF